MRKKPSVTQEDGMTWRVTRDEMREVKVAQITGPCSPLAFSQVGSESIKANGQGGICFWATTGSLWLLR